MLTGQTDESAADVCRTCKGTKLLMTDCSDETHFVFPLEQPYEINHLTEFLLGTGELRFSLHQRAQGSPFRPLASTRSS